MGNLRSERRIESNGSFQQTMFDNQRVGVVRLFPCAQVQRITYDNINFVFYIYIWKFPEMGVPLNHPFLIGCSTINHPFGGTPIYENLHIVLRSKKYDSNQRCARSCILRKYVRRKGRNGVQPCKLPGRWCPRLR